MRGPMFFCGSRICSKIGAMRTCADDLRQDRAKDHKQERQDHMAKIFCILGKSASGKDSIYRKLMEAPSLHLRPVVPYTPRPMRDQEEDGVDYHFVDSEEMRQMIAAGRVIERRSYQTVCGTWDYFTA